MQRQICHMDSNNWSPAPSAPPSYNTQSNNINLIPQSIQLDNFFDEFEISKDYLEKITILSDFNIIFLVDDSGSMKTPIKVNEKLITRWNLLQEMINISIRLTSIVNRNGIDLYFLNRAGRNDVHNYNYVKDLFIEEPFGRTPITKMLKFIFNNYKNNSKPTLIIIFTDGIPTNDMGYTDIKTFNETINKGDFDKFFMTFISCSDQKNDYSYLKKIKKLKHIDIVYDYLIERKKKSNYTLGDHIIRFMLGSILKDETKNLVNRCYP